MRAGEHLAGEGAGNRVALELIDDGTAEVLVVSYGSSYPEIAERLAQSGHYDLVCYGHDHQLSLRTYGKTLLINPGTLMGYLPGKAADTLPTFAMYDTETASATVYAIELPQGEVAEYSGPYFPQS